MIKIIVIEDHVMVRGFIARVCEDAFARPLVYPATTAAEGLALAKSVQPDLVLLDLELPDRDGLDLVADLRPAARSARILVLSAHIDRYSIHRIHDAGVDGFIDKNEQSPEVLCNAMREVAAGRRFFSAAVNRTRAALRADPHAFTKLLTDREIEALRLFGLGLGNEEVAARFGVTPLTARNHRRAIMTKLGIHSTPELVRYAIENGFTRIRPRTS
ncbi:MAG: response regulator transcription factor [Opitutaceae bacterium]|nr:response regulator transcription factor [Opitutaceae bacterium]